MLPELSSERLLFREIEISDADELHAYQSLPEQLFFMAVNPHEYDDGVLRVERYFEHRGDGDEQKIFAYVARQSEDNKLVGEVSLTKLHSSQASIGFSVAPDFWNKGYATEMTRRLLEYGFNDLGLHRIFANIAMENKASKRVAQKVGMQHEGTARECIWAQERWWSEDIFAILEDEFEMLGT